MADIQLHSLKGRWIALIVLAILIVVVGALYVFLGASESSQSSQSAQSTQPSQSFQPSESPVPSGPSSGSNGLLTHDAYITFSDDPTDFPAGTLVAEGASVPDVLVWNDLIWVYFVNAETAHLGDPSQNNIAVVLSKDGGNTWSDRQLISIEGLPDDIQPVDPSLVLLPDGRIRIYFYDFPLNAIQDTSDHYAAVSEDGLHFTFETKVLSLAGSGHTDPDVVYRNNGEAWFLYYVYTGGADGKIGVALSSDGLSFEDQGYLDAAEFNGIPNALVTDAGDIRLYSCLSASGIAEDGIHFQVDVGPFVEGGGMCDPSTDRYGEGYVLVYKKVDPSDNALAPAP